MVEAHRHIAGDLDVLTLVLADRYLIGVVQDDVGGLKGWVGEQSSGDEVALALGRLVLELRHPAQLAERDRALHHPAQLAVLGDMALHEHRGDVGIEPDSEQHRRQTNGRLADHAWRLGHRQRMQIDDPVERVGMLTIDPVAQGTQVVAQMDIAGGLDAREHAGHGAPG